MLKLAKKTAVGNPVYGIAVNGNRALVSATLAVAKNFGIMRPSILESDSASRKEAGSEGVALARLRRQVQRDFRSKRKHRATAYADYLQNVASGERQGGAPPINLYSSLPLIEEDGVLHIPFDADVFAIDGETQLEARFINAERNPESLNEDIPFIIWFGITPPHAAQIVHDFNTYANPISEKEMAARNSEGALTQAVRAGLEMSGVQSGAINFTGHSLRKKAYAMSFDQLLAVACGVIAPKEALQHGGIGRVLTQANAFGADIDTTKVAKVVSQVAKVAETNSAISRKTPISVWAALGAHASKGKAVAVTDFTKATNAYLKSPRGAKIEAAFKSLQSMFSL
jgi:hypothetical protein